MSIFDSNTPKPRSNPPAEAPRDASLIAFLELALEQARAGRVLLFTAAVGLVKDAPKPEPKPSLLIGIPAPEPSDQPPVSQFAVEIASFVGDIGGRVNPAALRSATNDVLKGAAFAAQQLMKSVTADTEEAMDAKRKSS